MSAVAEVVRACAREEEPGMKCPWPGDWQPVLLLYAPAEYHSPQPIRAALGMAVCDRHKDVARLEHFLSGPGWAQIVEGLRRAGKVAPDRARTQLAWRRYRDIGEELARMTPPAEAAS